MEIWVSILGILGSIGLLFGTYHAKHEIEHATHSMFLSLLVLLFGLAMTYTIASPVFNGHWNLNEEEIWYQLVFGTIGIGVLLFEAGHWLHHHPAIAQYVNVAGILILLVLWLTKPGDEPETLVAEREDQEEVEVDTASPIEEDGGREEIVTSGETATGTATATGVRNGLHGPPIPREELPDMFLPE